MSVVRGRKEDLCTKISHKLILNFHKFIYKMLFGLDTETIAFKSLSDLCVNY